MQRISSGNTVQRQVPTASTGPMVENTASDQLMSVPLPAVQKATARTKAVASNIRKRRGQVVLQMVPLKREICGPAGLAGLTGLAGLALRNQ
jgi:hypothetical protein